MKEKNKIPTPRELYARRKFQFLPETSFGETSASMPEPQEVEGDSPCPCCGYLTIPNHGDALAYICPVCFWEIDPFIGSDQEPSDQNHGLTLSQARENYKNYGAVQPELRQYCREPLEREKPRHQ